MKKLLAAVLVVALAMIAAPALAATNPFMDVPANHWAYDAVSQLASRGIISGYPDGTLKGAQPATRYEVASLIARSLARIDLEKASKQDVEMLKKLIVEFKDELDALGVKVDQLDERVAVIEKDLGGWSIAGELRFDAKFTGNGDENNWYGYEYTQSGKNEFDFNRYRIWLRKRIDENTSFTARLGAPGANIDGHKGVVWQQYYVTTKLPYDITFRVGRQPIDIEGDHGLYADEDTWAVDDNFNGFSFSKGWGVADFLLGVVRVGDNDWNPEAGGVESFIVAANLNANFNEKFRAGLIGYWWLTDDEIDLGAGNETDHDLSMYGAYLGFNFTPDIELKGIYYAQDAGESRGRVFRNGNGDLEDSSSAWKAMLDVKQEALKFTSLWLEYGQMDNNFELFGVASPYGWYGAEILENRPINTNSTKIILVRAEQQWNDKWRTLLRYAQANFDTDGLDNATNWTFEVGYQYSPAIEFSLGYDNIDYGDNNPAAFYSGDDHVIRFRTFVSF
jgi:hypothetical protein